MLAANVAMIAVLLWLQRPLDWWIDASLAARVLQLGTVVVAAAIAYFIALAVSGLRLSQLRLSARY
jgi:putative peptidoglycan lipid II flippase